MLVLADYGQSCWIIEHVGQCFGGEEAAADKSGLLGIPEGIIILIKLWNYSVFEVLL